jgi:hypothetical protein
VVEVDRDECDACPHDAHVQAFVYASHEGWPASLAYCAHHGTEYLQRLAEAGALVVDMRHLLTS